MEYLIAIFWILFSFAIGFFNRTRGNSTTTAFFLSIFLSPLLGFIIVILTPRNQEIIENRLLESGDVKRCPECAELIKRRARRCKYCLTVQTEDKIDTAPSGYIRRSTLIKH